MNIPSTGIKFKKPFFTVLILTIFCSISINFSLAEDPVWWDNGWGYREQIIIVNVGSSVLNNFPAYVKVPYRAGMQKNYNDIRFTNADNTLLLDYEIESYDTTHANVWIRIPELTSPNVSIWMYYGNINANSGENPTNVWDSNYILVQHLGESSGAVSDSTSYGNNGVPQNVEQNVLGKINGSVRFNLDNSYIDCGNSQSLNSPVNLCLEAWANTSNNNLTAKIVQKGDWDGYGIGQDKWQGWQGHIYFQDVGKISLDWGKKLPQANTWYYIAVTYDGIKMKLYVDGEQVAEAMVNKNPKSNNRNFYIGSDAGNQKFFKGGIDEVRMSNTTRSSDWIKQTYVMINSNSEYVGFGGIVPKPTQQKSLSKERLPMDQIFKILGLKNPKIHSGILYED